MLCSGLLILTGLLSLAPSGPSPSGTSRTALGRDAAGLLTAPDRRVRTTNGQIQRLLMSGARRSATFGALIAAINRTDVIVYIEFEMTLPNSLAGRLLLLPVVGDQRYLRIQLPAIGSADERIATIGHELQHVLEIAAAPDVRDQDALVRLYRRIGEAGTRAHTYDTVAAQMTGKTVRAELAG